MAIVQLNISDFRTFYPIFADAVQYPDNVITYAFNLAETYIDNTESSPIPYDPSKNILLRQRVLYMATCHLLQLNSQSPQQTGAVTSASQGSVSVGYSPQGSHYHLVSKRPLHLLQSPSPLEPVPLGIYLCGVKVWAPAGEAAEIMSQLCQNLLSEGLPLEL